MLGINLSQRAQAAPPALPRPHNVSSRSGLCELLQGRDQAVSIFPRAMAAPASGNAYLDEYSSDPLSFYAQVLAEAKTHAATESEHKRWHPSPTRAPPSQGKQGVSARGLKSWASKVLAFLKRPKKRHEAKVIPVQDATTKVRSSKYKSAPLQQPMRHRQHSSGPLYTDGTPLTPTHRSIRPKSGPLTPFVLPDAALSPYVPLRRSTNSRLVAGPVYLS